MTKHCGSYRSYRPTARVLSRWAVAVRTLLDSASLHTMVTFTRSYLVYSFVPEGTEVFVSPYHLHRDARYFSPETESFRPERWIEPGWNTQRAAYIPFSYGPAQCVGKNLARIEIIIVLSALLRDYDMSFAAGYDPKSFVEHIEEHLVVDIPPLLVRITRRT